MEDIEEQGDGQGESSGTGHDAPEVDHTQGFGTAGGLKEAPRPSIKTPERPPAETREDVADSNDN